MKEREELISFFLQSKRIETDIQYFAFKNRLTIKIYKSYFLEIRCHKYSVSFKVSRLSIILAARISSSITTIHHQL